uniref:Tetratricopeptide repeat protein n=2 Tax=Timema TaxID=61471 RepID=A0A7R9K037_TIMGE|nr:unnamed protein product [Timema genevievae]
MKGFKCTVIRHQAKNCQKTRKLNEQSAINVKNKEKEQLKEEQGPIILLEYFWKNRVQPITIHKRTYLKDVQDLFIMAARRNPKNDLDPDVQCGLGVLFNLSDECDKAADCFKTALLVKSDHHVLLPVRVVHLSTNYTNVLGIGKVEFRGSEPAFAWRESGKPFRNPTPSSPNQDSNLDLPILGGLAQHDWLSGVGRFDYSWLRADSTILENNIACTYRVKIFCHTKQSISSEVVLTRDMDFRLWNRLGATLANGQWSEEAVEAYHNALRLSPGFIRARYNLGITCVNLQAYREAAEHFLACLNQQAAGKNLEGKSSNANMSSSIWSSLRLVVSSLDRHDLIDAVDNRNLLTLNKEFQV